jgi:hypothetical protein
MQEGTRLYGYRYLQVVACHLELFRMYELRILRHIVLRVTLVQRDASTTSFGIGIHRYELSWAFIIWDKHDDRQ